MITQDLRIGNSIATLIDSPVIVKEIYESSILVQFKSEKREVYELDQLKPVLLTPEILEQCGFVRTSGDLCWMHQTKRVGEFLLSGSNSGFARPGWSYEADFQNRFIRIPYLHSLQNFWLVYWNEELTVNVTANQPA